MSEPQELLKINVDKTIGKNFLRKIFNVILIGMALSIGCLGILLLLLALITELTVASQLYLWGSGLLVSGGVLFFIISLLNKVTIKKILMGYLLGVMGTFGLLLSCCGLGFSVEALMEDSGGIDGLVIICMIIGVILAFSMWFLFVAVYVRHKNYLDLNK